LDKLKGGDRRSIGRADEVAAEVLAQPALFPFLMAGILNDDSLVRMRSADAVEKVTRVRPGWLRPYRAKLFALAEGSSEKEVRWNIVQILSRVKWRRGDQRRLMDLLIGFLQDGSSIVKTCSMQALADLAGRDETIREEVVRIIEGAMKTGTPAMKARARKILKR